MPLFNICPNLALCVERDPIFTLYVIIIEAVQGYLENRFKSIYARPLPSFFQVCSLYKGSGCNVSIRTFFTPNQARVTVGQLVNKTNCKTQRIYGQGKALFFQRQYPKWLQEIAYAQMMPKQFSLHAVKQNGISTQFLSISKIRGHKRKCTGQPKEHQKLGEIKSTQRFAI